MISSTAQFWLERRAKRRRLPYGLPTIRPQARTGAPCKHQWVASGSGSARRPGCALSVEWRPWSFGSYTTGACLLQAAAIRVRRSATASAPTTCVTRSKLAREYGSRLNSCAVFSAAELSTSCRRYAGSPYRAGWSSVYQEESAEADPLPQGDLVFPSPYFKVSGFRRFRLF